MKDMQLKNIEINTLNLLMELKAMERSPNAKIEFMSHETGLNEHCLFD